MVHRVQISQGGGGVSAQKKGAHTYLDKRVEPLAQNLLVLSRGRAVEQLAKLLLLLRKG